MESDYPRVVTYVNIRLISLCFALCKDIINYKDILLKYLKDTEVNIWNLLIIIGNFNICNNLWDPLFPHHSSISDDLLIIADLFNLELSNLTNQVLTRYLDNGHDSNLVIVLIFLHNGSSELDSHLIYPNWQLSSNYAPLTIVISITQKHINSRKCSIIKNSKEKSVFIKDLISAIRYINTSNMSDTTSLDRAVNEFTIIVENAWEKNLKVINITKYSKS